MRPAVVKQHPIRTNSPGTGAELVALALSLPLAVCVCSRGQPPGVPEISGPAHARQSDPVAFLVWSTDPDGDSVAYRFEWGDDSQHDTSSYYRSGDTVELSHTYSDTGVYSLRAQAVDTRGKTSDWCTPRQVSVSQGSLFWEPDSEDLAAIHALVDAERPSFGCNIEEGRLVEIDTVLPGTTAARLRDEITTNPFRQRFRCDSLQHEFLDDSLVFGYDLLPIIDALSGDTLCFVSMAETVPGILRMHAYSYTRFLRDTIIIPSPGETLRLQLYDTVFTDTSMKVEKRLYGTSSDGCLLAKTGGQWEIAELMGGSRFHAPDIADAPYLVYVVLLSSDGRDTVYYRPDTLHYGMQRSYRPAELPGYEVGDTVRVCASATTVEDAASYTYLYGARHELSDAVDLNTPGIHRFYFECIPIEVLYEMVGEYVASVWGIRISVSQ